MLQSGNINDMSVPYSPNAVALQADGKIPVAGYRTEAGEKVAVLRRYLQSGWVDTSFVDSGTAIFSGVSHSYGSLNHITVLANGKILVSGISSRYVGNTIYYNTLVWRFKANGVYDAAWGETGRAVLRGAGSVLGAYFPAGSSSQKVFVGFRGDSEYRLHRLLSNRALAPAFSSDGKQTTDFAGSGDHGQAVAIQTDGKILVVRHAANGDETSSRSRYLP